MDREKPKGPSNVGCAIVGVGAVLILGVFFYQATLDPEVSLRVERRSPFWWSTSTTSFIPPQAPSSSRWFWNPMDGSGAGKVLPPIASTPGTGTEVSPRGASFLSRPSRAGIN